MVVTFSLNTYTQKSIDEFLRLSLSGVFGLPCNRVQLSIFTRKKKLPPLQAEKMDWFCLYVSLQESDFSDIPDTLKFATLIVGVLVVFVITAAVLEGGFSEAVVAICVSVFTIIPILLEFSRQVRLFSLVFKLWSVFSSIFFFFWRVFFFKRSKEI